MRYRNHIALMLLVLAVSSVLACSNWNRNTPANVDNAAIEAEIRKNLAADGITGLKITVDDGVVTLEGHISSKSERDKALAAAQIISGVRRVVDRMHFD